MKSLKMEMSFFSSNRNKSNVISGKVEFIEVDMLSLADCVEGKLLAMHHSGDTGAFDQPDIIIEADWEVVRRCQHGDANAFQELVEKYQNQVASIMWRFSRELDTHQDLVQDVFVEAYTSLKNYRPQAPFFHWLSRIAVRVGYRHWKKLKKQRDNPHVSLDEWEQLADTKTPDVLAGKEAADILHRLLGQLTSRNRMVLTLRFVEEKSVKETSELTGWSQTMVKVQTLRARKQLKKLFEKSQVKEKP
jgi:RNA polymerase sigma-70 factor (ECF subfamily)